MDALTGAPHRMVRRVLELIASGARPLCAVLLLIAFTGPARAADVAAEFPQVFLKPQGIVAGPDGNLWFAEEDGNEVKRISPTGTPVGSTALSPSGTPQGIAVGPDGNVWVTEPGVNMLARLDGHTGARLAEYPAPGAPENVAAGPDGNVWFTENLGDKVGRMDTSGGNLKEFDLPVGSHPNGIVAGPCGDPHMWVTEEDGAAVVALDLSGNVVTSLTFTTGAGSILRGIAAGADCNLYYANRGHDTIGRVQTSGGGNDSFVSLPAGSRPIGIVVSAQGDLWFTLNGGNAIGRSPSASVSLTTYSIPTPGAFPDGIGLGPSGGATIYFTEAGGNHVGYVSLGATSSGPDLSITKTVTQDDAPPGRQTLLYKLTYKNIGAQSSDDVVVDENIPFLTTFQAGASSAGWECDDPKYVPVVGGGTCHLNLGTLAPGAGDTLNFEVKEGETELAMPPEFSIYNLTSIAGTGIDADPTNNVYDIATPDAHCADTLDPLQYLLCQVEPQAAPAPWLARVIAKAGSVVQQLKLYFQLRDSVFLTSPSGRRWFDNYRAHSAEVRTLLGNDSNLRNLGIAVVGAWRDPIQTYLNHGSVPVLSQNMYATMTAFLNRLRALATPELRALLNFPRFQGMVGLPLDQYVLALDKSPCHASDTSLCLHGGRFRIEARWRDGQGNTGIGHGVSLTGDSGYFWFFSNTNVEVLLKALDACGVNGKFWLFAGGLTNVQLTLSVTDTVTGQVKEYSNPSGTAFEAILDTGAFETCSAVAAPPSAAHAATDTAPASMSAHGEAALLPCEFPPTTLCLDNGRYTVEAAYRTPSGASGDGQAVALTADTGYFWFFSADNVEVILKVLDGCAINGHHWVFSAGLTNVEVTLTVTDHTTGQQKQYVNALGTQYAPVQDTSALPCP